MSFDGITTAACAAELRAALLHGRIDKIYQPEPDDLMIQIYTKQGIRRLFATVNSQSASLRLVGKNTVNPPVPHNFCMLLRKQLSGARICEVEQKGSERIIEISVEVLDEMGFTVSRKLIFEIMGRHSNISLVNLSDGKIIDCIKHITPEVSRARQLLPGLVYQYPPAQDKIPFREASEEDLENAGGTWKALLARIGGISPASAREIFVQADRKAFLRGVLASIEEGTYSPVVYEDENGLPVEYSVFPLSEYEQGCRKIPFATLSEALEYFYEHRASSSRARQRAHDLIRSVQTKLDKLYLKKQRLSEDLLQAENSGDLRLYGELLTASLGQIRPGADHADVTNYYTGETVSIPLDPRLSPSRNAQQYFKRYGKARTAIHEKQVQLDENQQNIDYLESVLTYLNNTNEVRDIDDLRRELEDTGVIRVSRQTRRSPKKKFKAQPISFTTSDGFEVWIGRNNRENDELTLRMAARTDYWLHTKDIPGSHVILRTGGKQPTETALFEAAAAAAYYSKARESENVPVDYVPVRRVKKPAGAKPGMVIFTGNRTIYVNPKNPLA